MERKKTLYDLLKNADPEAVYHIGTQKGSGFFYIGTAGDFDESWHNRNTIERIHKRIEKQKEIIDSAGPYILPKSIIPVIRADKDDPEAYTLACERLYKELMSAAKDVLEHANIIEAASRKIKAAQKDIEEFKSFLERTVVDSYDRIQEDGIVVILTGKEDGAYWYKAEYDAKKAEAEADEED
jgi:hypothetical protein